MYDLSSPKQASDLLKAHGLRAQKRLGQNFLCDRNTLNRIVGAANLTPLDPVVEIGGGLGALTLSLAEVCLAVTTIEIDRNLEPILAEVTSLCNNVHLIFEDYLRLDTSSLFHEAFGDKPGTVVANIPYYITTPIIESLLDRKHHLKRVVLLVQHEFARRMAAGPGSDDCGALSLFVQFHANVELIGKVSPSVFLPSPEVTSEIVALTPIQEGAVQVQNPERMFRVIRAAFGQRRKTLVNALMRAPESFALGFDMNARERVEALMARASIDGGRRGETLSLAEFARISDAFE